MKKRLLFTIIALLTLSGCVLNATNQNGNNNPVDDDPQIVVHDVAVTAIVLDVTSKELTIGNTLQLNATVKPSNATDKSLTWSSSNSAVASVTQDGKIEALRDGTTKITAKSNSKSNITASCTVTVKNSSISVTSVSLNKTSASLYVGDKLTLTESIKPSNATNKNVTWSSSDTSVATVNNGSIEAVSVGSAKITVKTIDGNKTASCTVTISEKQVVTKAAWTVMIYLCGADLESGTDENGKTHINDASLATADITEILSVAGQPNDVNIIVETGGAAAWNSKYGISTSKLGRWHVSNKRLVKDAELSYAGMGETSTFQSFLKWGLESYPAEKTGVILWNHGGAMKGVCYDEKKNSNPLLNSEIQSALSNTLSEGEKLEFIGYDACLMGVQDIAITNSKYFNYMVASEESEAGEGWDYDTWVDDLYAKKSTETILQAICDGFIADTDAMYKQNKWGDSDQTLAYYDLSYADEYKTNWEALATKMKNAVTSLGGKSSFRDFMVQNVKSYADEIFTQSDIQEYADYYNCSTQYIISQYGLTLQSDGKYHSYYGAYNYGTFDAKDFINKAKKNSGFSSLLNELNAVDDSFNKLVKYNATGKGAGESYGMTMFYSAGNGCSKSSYYTKSQTDLTNWVSFNNSYGY